MNHLPPDPLADRLAGLLAQCALKNQRAFEDLYTLTSAKLFGAALRILRRQDWAEEVLQECYVNIWNHAGDYAAARSAPLTWMTSIVRNRALDWLRRPHAETTGEEYEIAVEAWQDHAPGPDGEARRRGRSGRAGALPEATGSEAAAEHRARFLPRSVAFRAGGAHEGAAGNGEDLGTQRIGAAEDVPFRHVKGEGGRTSFHIPPSSF